MTVNASCTADVQPTTTVCQSLELARITVHLVMALFSVKTGNNVFVPAAVTFAGFLALLFVFSLFRYSQGASQVSRTAADKYNGRNVRRSTRSVNRS